MLLVKIKILGFFKIQLTNWEKGYTGTCIWRILCAINLKIFFGPQKIEAQTWF